MMLMKHKEKREEMSRKKTVQTLYRAVGWLMETIPAYVFLTVALAEGFPVFWRSVSP